MLTEEIQEKVAPEMNSRVDYERVRHELAKAFTHAQRKGGQWVVPAGWLTDQLDRIIERLQAQIGGQVIMTAHHGIVMMIRDDTCMAPALKKGAYESMQTDQVRGWLSPEETFVDIGANAGYYSLLAAKAVGPKGRVIACEPDPTSLVLFEENVRLNGFQNITIHQRAMGNRIGTNNLYLSADNAGDHRLWQNGGERDSVSVLEDRLDDLLGPISDLHLIKIDVQGYEVDVLWGAERLLRWHHGGLAMAIEYWPQGIRGAGRTCQDLLDIVFDLIKRIYV